MTDAFVASVRVPGRRESIRAAASFVVGIARSFDVPPAADSLFENAVVEALNNAIGHNPRRHDQSIVCEIEVRDRRLTVRVLDEAARAPLALRAPAPPVGLEPGSSWRDLPESGYGLYLIRAVFPEVRPVTQAGRHGLEMAIPF